jgi:lysozyme family protein
VHHSGWDGWPLIDSGDRKSAELLELHRAFYLKWFWTPIRGDEINDQEMAEKIYDAAVNCGVFRAVQWAQHAANLSSREPPKGQQLVVDGRMGPQTLYVLNHHIPKGQRRWLWFQVFETQQEHHYVSLALRDPTQKANLLGWYSHRIFHRKDA